MTSLKAARNGQNLASHLDNRISWPNSITIQYAIRFDMPFLIKVSAKCTLTPSRPRVSGFGKSLAA